MYFHLFFWLILELNLITFYNFCWDKKCNFHYQDKVSLFIDKIGDSMSVSEVQGENLASRDQRPPTSKHRRKQRKYSWLVLMHTRD